MKFLIRKPLILGGMLLVLASATVLATGGGGAGHAGDQQLKILKLETNWNGNAGMQQTNAGSLKIQWYADACGHKIQEPLAVIGWGAPRKAYMMPDGGYDANDCKDNQAEVNPPAKR
jgi:hypothetical protein